MFIKCCIGNAGPSVQNNGEPPIFGESSSYRDAMKSSSHVTGLVEIHLGQVLGIEHKYTFPSIENIRFSNEIHYKIQVDEDVDTESIKIPSLVLQPFLENALWHGLSPKKDDKFINLSVSKTENNFVSISITDNGIGRTASAKIKEKKLLKQKSLGIDITKQRLANFSKNYTESFELMINDLYDSNNQPSGTCVVLKLPIIPLQKLRTA